MSKAKEKQPQSLVDLKIDATSKAKEKQGFLSQRFSVSHRRQFVLGLSGGIDSAVSGALAVNAVGPDHLIAVEMPYGDMGKQACDDADLLVTHFKLLPHNVYRVNIRPTVDAFIETMAPNDTTESAVVRKGNAMARVRMMTLYHIAHDRTGQVLGTENKSEHYWGYFTRGGDEISDNEPIGDLYKTQVWQLAKHLKIPKKIIDKKPTADLWAGQTDEGELGFSYFVGDQILHCYLDFHETCEQITNRGFESRVVDRVVGQVVSTHHKREVPYHPWIF